MTNGRFEGDAKKAVVERQKIAKDLKPFEFSYMDAFAIAGRMGTPAGWRLQRGLSLSRCRQDCGADR